MDEILMTCESCGGQLVPVENDPRFWKCQYCNTIVPARVSLPPKLLLELNQADLVRRSLKFSDALRYYGEILKEEPFCSEAYWGLVLSKLGIEYVKDKDGKYLPTCHRASFQSIMTDADFLKALQYATSEDIKADYAEKARVIEEIRLKLLDLSKGNEKYDIFICFKATEEVQGKKHPTKESLTAQSLYHQLEKLGYKVFFSTISLEKHLGENYEPYIFSALNTCKCMLLFCFNPEFIESAWVKNEWTRYLELISNGFKLPNSLIPLLNDVNPNELPFELQRIEGLNIEANVDWWTTLSGMVRKIVDSQKSSLERHMIKKQEFKKSEKVFNQVSKITRNFELKGQPLVEPTIESKLDLAYKFLGKGDFNNARRKFSQIIEENPGIHRAYWGLMLAKLKVIKEENITGVCGLDSFQEFINAVNYSTTEGEARNYLNTFQKALLQEKDTAPVPALIKGIDTCMQWEPVDATNFYDSFIYKFVDLPFSRGSATLFDAIKKYIPEAMVDFYLNYLERFADANQQNRKVALRYFDEILSIEKDNCRILWKKFKLFNPLATIRFSSRVQDELNRILEYGFYNESIIEELIALAKSLVEKDTLNIRRAVTLFEYAVSWIQSDLDEWYAQILFDFANFLAEHHQHRPALKYFNEMLALNIRDSRGYIGRLMCRYGCSSYNELPVNITRPLLALTDYNNAINCDDCYQEKHLELIYKQECLDDYKDVTIKGSLKTILRLTVFLLLASLPIFAGWLVLGGDGKVQLFVALIIAILSAFYANFFIGQSYRTLNLFTVGAGFLIKTVFLYKLIIWGLMILYYLNLLGFLYWKIM